MAQLERLPLVRGHGSDSVSFRILALDGGGLKGAFTASVLATWENRLAYDYRSSRSIAETSAGQQMLNFTGGEDL